MDHVRGPSDIRQDSFQIWYHPDILHVGYLILITETIYERRSGLVGTFLLAAVLQVIIDPVYEILKIYTYPS